MYVVKCALDQTVSIHFAQFTLWLVSWDLYNLASDNKSWTVH